MLATFTLNNVRLLALSKIGTQYDPTTAKGTLGKNLTHQVGGAGTRLFFDHPLNLFMGSGALGMMFADFDGDNGLTGSEGIVRAGHIAVGSSGNRPIASFGQYPTGAAKSNWGSQWKAASLEWRDRVSGIGFTGEHLAYRQNFMDLDPTYTDKLGDPLLRFTLDWTEHEHRQRVFAAGIQLKVAKAMGVKFEEPHLVPVKYNVVQYQTTHIQGGAIMGTSPENSVVNTNLQHWDVPNLWVVGASAFPQNASAQSDPDRARNHLSGGRRIHRAARKAIQGGRMKRREFLSIPATGTRWNTALHAGPRTAAPSGAGRERQHSASILLRRRGSA